MKYQPINQKTGIDHVAYATRNTDNTIGFLATLGFDVKIYKVVIEKQNVYVSKVSNQKGDVIEIVEPIGYPSAFDDILGERDAAVYHTCFMVDDFEEIVSKVKKAGAIAITRPFESILYEGYRVTHMYHPSFGMFEIFGI